MEPQQGRIIHALYNEGQQVLTLQYSRLFDFACKEAPLELSYIYFLSSPIKPRKWMSVS